MGNVKSGSKLEKMEGKNKRMDGRRKSRSPSRRGQQSSIINQLNLPRGRNLNDPKTRDELKIISNGLKNGKIRHVSKTARANIERREAVSSKGGGRKKINNGGGFNSPDSRMNEVDDSNSVSVLHTGTRRKCRYFF